MTQSTSDTDFNTMTAVRDEGNLAVIENARKTGRINDEAARYLSVLYSDSAAWCREVFYFLGKCFGAPKAPVMQYDYASDSAIDEPIKIADINPLTPYLVQHRLDADPMRNQFFNSGRGHKIDLAVSSIVTVIVGAQKSIERSLDKVTGKYYSQYVNDVCNTVHSVIAAHESEESAQAFADKVREKLSAKYISAASETVLSIIGPGHENIAVELVRALDRVPRPHMCLQDVWRVKCLFDLIPQVRTFIERVRQQMPERILSVRDIFYDIGNPRNYRDAKLIINIGTGDKIIPMEIICQVRTFFEYERKTHVGYEAERKSVGKQVDEYQTKIVSLHEAGVQEYNRMVCNCLEDLFERVGWNILYLQDNGVSLFEGFPRDCTMYYPQKIYDSIMGKLDNALENEVFHVTSAPTKLTPAQESKIFRYMAHFVLVTAMPYMQTGWDVPSNTMAGKLFNFVMTEVQRYYKKPTDT